MYIYIYIRHRALSTSWSVLVNPNIVYWSLLIDHCALIFVNHCSLTSVHWTLFIDHCSLNIVHWSLFIDHCSKIFEIFFGRDRPAVSRMRWMTFFFCCMNLSTSSKHVKIYGFGPKQGSREFVPLLGANSKNAILAQRCLKNWPSDAARFWNFSRSWTSPTKPSKM